MPAPFGNQVPDEEMIKVNLPFKGEGAAGAQPSAGEVTGGTSPNRGCGAMRGAGTVTPAPTRVPRPKVPFANEPGCRGRGISRAEMAELQTVSFTAPIPNADSTAITLIL